MRTRELTVSGECGHRVLGDPALAFRLDAVGRAAGDERTQRVQLHLVDGGTHRRDVQLHVVAVVQLEVTRGVVPAERRGQGEYCRRRALHR